MIIVSKLANRMSAVWQDLSNNRDFKQQLIAVCSDGKVTEVELALINDLAYDYNIEKEDFKKFNTAGYKAAFKAIISDGIITEQEEIDIIETQHTLMVTDKQIPKQLVV